MTGSVPTGVAGRGGRLLLLAYDDGDVLDAVSAWAKAGLTSTFLAVDLQQVQSADDHHVWMGVRIDSDGASAAHMLTEHLADANPDETIVVATRGVASAGGRPAAMENLEEHLRSRLVQEHRGAQWIDLVFPWEEDKSSPLRTTQEATFFWTPPRVKSFRQVLLSPEDSKAPGETDVGVTFHAIHGPTEGSHVPTLPLVMAHAALTIGGAMGGTWSTPVLAGRDRLGEADVFRCHLRAVAGGRDCCRRTAEFVRDELFDGSIAEVDAENFAKARSGEGNAASDNAVGWFRQRHGIALTYVRPGLDTWQAAEGVSIWRHLLRVVGFVPFALGAPFPKARAVNPGATFGARFESEDLGYTVGGGTGQTPGQPKISPLDWRSWPAMDTEQANRAQAEIRRLRRGEVKDPDDVWDDLTMVTTGLCDGAETPLSEHLTTTGERRLVLKAEVVAEPRETQMVAGPDMLEYVLDHGAMDSLDDESRPVAEDSLRSVQHALEGLEDSRAEVLEQAFWLLPIAGADFKSSANGHEGGNGETDRSQLRASTVTRTAASLAGREDAERQQTMGVLRRVLPGRDHRPNLSMLGRLRAATIADLILATVDAARWEKTATSPTTIDNDELEAELKPRIRKTQIVASGGVLGAVAWWLGGGPVTSLLNSLLDTALQPSPIGLALLAMWSVVFMLSVAAAYRVVAAAAERARRKMELRRKALAAVKLAHPEVWKLELSDRVLAQWVEIVSESLLRAPSDIATESPLDDATKVPVPASMQIAEPDLGRREEKDLREILRRIAFEPGWRLMWLQDLVASTRLVPDALMSHESRPGVENRVLEPLFPDDAFGDTTLRRVRETLVAEGAGLAQAVGLTRVAIWSGELADRFYSRGQTPVRAPLLTDDAMEASTVGMWLQRIRRGGSFRHVFNIDHEDKQDSVATTFAASPMSALRAKGQDYGMAVHSQNTGDSGGVNLVQTEPRAPGLTTVLVRCDVAPGAITRLKVRPPEFNEESSGDIEIG